MVYGVVSKLDDAKSKALFQSKRVVGDKIYYNTNLNALANRLQSGDVVWVVDLNRFINLTQLKAFAEHCHERSVALRFISQPYLDIWNGRCWKSSFIHLVDKMIMLEQVAKGKMHQGFRMSDEQWRYVYACIESMSLEILSEIFSPDGILKRGN